MRRRTNSKTALVCALFLFTLTQTATAADLDKYSSEALEKTKELLVSPDQRAEAIQKSPSAAAADKKVDALTNSPEDKQAIYELAAKIFGNTTNQTQGDVDAQKALLEEALRDPEKLVETLPADQQKDLSELAARLEKKDEIIASPR